MWVWTTDGELVNLGHARRVRIDRLRADRCDVVAWFGVELGNVIKIAEGIPEPAAKALMTAFGTQVLQAAEVTEAGELRVHSAASDGDGVPRADRQ
ncbi:hypothetical protein SAMN05421678_1048 [Actinopolymorpha cephalotaxi]|uniref:Uncharacterized protein n=1 Tax=Actinopolymorpha cephalotaxi TaxID=504797 RepID=A0A1I2P615_9ACTN|nr:hypothetical protein [Actinopolymorpha cephalotaxi]NYH83740.1 hypothetical protein [Actinopolymorpha cephalotaxi]SFG11504.1 hypothetical protein SAMN05421678_1048 [Actinopolymorpha cephalotaxi]